MISCHRYDYIEIVCMYHYPVIITLIGGKVITGIAMDTVRNIRREECIKVDVDGVMAEVVLDTISRLEVSIENPHITSVSFT